MMLIEHPFKALGSTSIAPFVNFLDSHELPWKTIENPYSKRETLPVLWCNREMVDGKIKILRLVQTNELIQLTNSALKALQTFVPGIPIRVFYAKLMPRDSILTHVDNGDIFRVSHRCHLPIKAPEGIEFHCANETYIPTVGEWFELNNCLPHSVSNMALSERLHLIVDVLQQEQEHLLG
jgi:hypothetical protein